MKDDLTKLIRKYEDRAVKLESHLKELSLLPPSRQVSHDLNSLKLACSLWTYVIKDLKEIADKF